MDPTAALEGARMAADALAQLLDVDDTHGPVTDPLAYAESLEVEAGNLLTNFRSLDDWLTQGGFRPEPWQRNADQLGVPADGEYGWMDFESEPDGTGDGSGDPDKHILTIGLWDHGAFSQETCVIVHRTCDGKYPLDGPLAESKRATARHIVKVLNENKEEDD